MPTHSLYYWKCQKCGQVFERVSKGEPRFCPVCRDKGTKTFVRSEGRGDESALSVGSVELR